jgi:hypothetical protein
MDVDMNKDALRTILAGGLIMLLATLAAAQFASSRWSLRGTAERWEFLMQQLRR